MLAWINFFDVGLGHGLRNKMAVALAKDEMDKAKSYVSTAYVSITILCVGLFLVFLVINNFLNWNTLLNIPKGIDEDIKTIAVVVFSMFSVQFVLQLINSIFLSTQQSALVSFYNMIANLVSLVAIFLLIQFSKESLYNIAFVFSVIPLLVFGVVNLYYFKTKFKNFAPSFKYYDKEVLKDVLSVGVKFFIIQVSVLVLYQTSNLLICRYFSPDLVTPYNIAFRYFGIVTMGFSIIALPYWSAYTEAYIKQDYEWIKKTMRQTFKIWLLFAAGAILMLIFSEQAYYLWVGDKVKIDFKISLFMMIYVLLISFGSIFMMFLNGIGNIKLQMAINIIGMIVFIPLSYYLSVTLNLGIIGIIISTIICSIYGPLIAPLQVRSVLKKLQVKGN
jgi:O-antigen/teichoic acid export membrane protein